MNGIHLACLALVGCATTDPAPSNLLVSDYAADAIFRFDGITGEYLGTFAAGSEQRVDRPAGVRRGPDGAFYAAGFGRGEIVRYDPTGRMMDIFYRDTTLLEEPVELAFLDDALLVLGNDTASIVVIGHDGTASRSFGYPTMRGAHDFVLDGEIAIVGTDSHAELGHAIQRWDIATGTLVDHFGTLAEIASATSVARVGDALVVADWERDRLVSYDAVTRAYRGVFADELEGPISLDLGPDGALYVLDRAGVHRLDAETGARLASLVAADETGTMLEFPRSLTFVTSQLP